jgi:hypothetical protein
MSSRIRVPENVPGDFYVEEGCCTRCEVPAVEAPEHFAYSEDSCYVCRQPHTPDEVVRMVNAIQVQELNCIRYGGRQRDVQIRLVAIGAAEYCDDLLPDLAVPSPKRSVPVKKFWATALWRRIRG